MNTGSIPPADRQGQTASYLSLAIIAWNEEKTIGATLDSLFGQTLFAELARRGLRCEVICVANGCTDRTPEVALEHLSMRARSHPLRSAFTVRVVHLERRGKINAWNTFVHSLSAREARFLFLMDADILIEPRETLWNMLLALENDAEASVTVDQPRKDIAEEQGKGIAGRLSLSASDLTRAAEAQLCGQLYCIRTDIARNIHLPKDLAACEDGFIKALVCTDFISHPVNPRRIRLASGAGHIFEAYTSLAGILKNQKRQAIGQTIVHILVDHYLPGLSASQRSRLAETLRARDEMDPDWLKRLIAEHLKRTRFFWNLFPGIVSYRFQRLASMPLLKRLACLPAAVAGMVVSLISAFRAWRFLKAGATDYWPKADRGSSGGLKWPGRPAFQFSHSDSHQE